jgi:hypothetical protein
MALPKPKNLAAVQNKIGKIKSPSKTPYDPAKQVAGYKTRLEAAGVPKAQIKDTRNPLERLLNVKPDQPWFFDVLEIADRPRSALAGTVSALQKNEDPFQAVLKGLSGEKDTSWKEMFTNMGAVDRPGQLDVVDIIGGAMDIFVDPIDWALFPVSAFTGTAGKAILKSTVGAISDYNKVFGKLNDAVPLSRLADKTGNIFVSKTATDSFQKTFENLSARLRRTVKSDKALEMANYLSQAANAKTVGEYKAAVKAFGSIASQPVRKNALELSVMGIKNTMGYSVGFLDDSLTKIINKVDERLIRTDPKFLKEFQTYGKSVLNISIYNDLKKWVTTIFNATARLPQGLMNKIKGVSGNKQLFDEYGKAYLKKVDTIVDNVANKTGQSKDVIQKQILRHIEYEDLDYKTTLWDMVTDEDAMGTIAKTKGEAELIRNFLSRVTDKRGNKIYSPEALKKIFNTVTKNGVEFNYFNKKSIAYIKKSVEDYFRMVKNLKVKIKGDRLAFYRTLKSQLTKSINTGKFYDDAFIKQYNKFKNIPEFQNAVQEIRNTVKDMYKTIDDLSSSGYTEKIVRGRRGKVKTVESAVLKGNEFVTDPKTGKLVLRDRVIVPRETLPDAKQLLKATENETFKLQRLKGNVKVSSERVYRMSAYEANQMIKATSENLLKNEKISEKTRLFLMIRKNQDLFSEYINTSLADFVINKSSTAFQTSVIDNIIVTGVFSNPDLVDVYKGGRVPLGKTTFAKQALIKKLEDLKPYHIDETVFDEGIKTLRGMRSDSIIIENNVLDMLALPKDNDQVKEALRLFDKLNTFFKSTKLLSPGFHVRNFIGNFSNMMLAGINPMQTAKYQDDVFKIMSTGPELLERAVNAGAHLDPTLLNKVFNPSEKRLYEILVDYTKADLPKSAEALYDYPEALQALIRDNPEKKTVFEQISKVNSDWNEKVDTYFRLQTFIYGRENAQLLGRLGAQNPAELVRRVHFDPKDLSPTERNTLKRIIPFYTYTKKNLAFQMKNVFDNPTIYKRLTKAMDSAWTTLDIDPATELEDYKRVNYWIPVWKKKDGKYFAIKANLPVGDLVEFLKSPGSRILSSVAPAIRIPFELGLNRQIYSGLPIRDFPGQKGYMFPALTEIPGVGPMLDRQAEYLIAQTGLDVPFRLLYGTGEAAFNIATGKQDVGSAIASGPLSSALGEGSKEKALKSKAYKELERMQQLVSYYKQQGVDVPTLAEIENKRNSLNQLRKKIKSRLG